MDFPDSFTTATNGALLTPTSAGELPAGSCHALPDMLPWGVLALAPTGTATYLNATAAALWGVPAPAVVGRAPAQVEPAVLPAELLAALTQPAAAPADYWLPHTQQWVALRTAPAPDGQRWVFWDNVTARHQAEAAQQQSSELLLNMEEAVHTGSYESDLATGTFHFSDGLYHLFGEAPRAFEPTLAIIDARSHPADAATVRQVLDQAVHDKQPYTYRRRIYWPTGEQRTLEAHGRVVCDAAGRPLRLRGLVQDITEWVVAEQALQQSHELLQRTIDSSLDLVQVFEAVRDEQGDVIDFTWVLNNAAAEQVYGDVIGQRLCQLNPGVVEEGIFDTFRQVLATGVPDQRERHYVHEQFDGWFYQSTVQLGDGVATTTHDITARKQAEQALRQTKGLLQAVLDSSRFEVQAFRAVRNAEGRIVDFTWLLTNQAWSDSYGGDMTGKSLLQQNPGVIDSGLFDLFVQVTETGAPVDHEQYYAHEQFNGWFHQTLVKLGDGFVMNTVDITERKQAQEEILRLKEALAQQALDRYHSLFHTMEEGVFILEMVYDDGGKPVDMRCVEVNPAFEKITGLTDVAGQLTSTFVPTEQYWLDAYDSVVKTGQSLRYENYHAGINQWYRTHTSRIGGPQSRIVANVFEDITERKRHEAQLRLAAEAETFRLELADALAPLNNPVAIQEAVTRTARRHFGADRCYYCEIENGQFIIRRDAAAEGLPSVAGTYPVADFALLRAVVEAGRPFIVRDVRQDPAVDENLRQLCVQLQVISYLDVPVMKNGQPVGVLCLVQSQPRDWTTAEAALAAEVAERTWAAVERARVEEALRASEEKYRTLFDSIDEGFLIHEMVRDENGHATDFRLLEINPAFTRQTGLREDTVGKLASEFLPNLERFWIDTYDRVARTGTPERVENYNQATRRWYSVHVSRVGGQDLRVAAVFEDVTERKQREQRQAFLLQFSDALRAEPDADAVANRALHLLAEQLRLDRCYITTYHLAENRADLDYQLGNDSVPPLPAHFVLSDYPEAFATTLRNTVVIEDAWERQGLSDAEQRNSARLGMRAMVAATLRKENKPLWSMAALNARPRCWTPGEIALVEEVAERTWAALERARAEQALRASEERLQTLIANLPGAAVFIVDRALRYQLAEGEALRTVGYEPADFRGRLVRELAPPGQWPAFRHQYTQALAGQAFEYEHAQGGRIFLTRGVPLPGPGGAVEAVLAVSYDITARKQAEEVLRQNEAQLEQQVAERTQQLQESRDLLHSVLNNSPMIIAVLQAVRGPAATVEDFVFTLTNKEQERIASRSDLVGQYQTRLYPGVRESGVWKVMLRALATGEPQQVEYYYPHEGLNRWFLSLFSKLGDSLVSITLDITKRKTAEQERLKNLHLLEQAEAVAGLGSWDYDLATGTMRWSDGMYHLFGLPAGSPVAPSYYLDAVLDEDRPRAEPLVRQLAAGEGFEETLRLRVGEQVKTVRLKAVVLHDEAGQPVRVLGVDLDISELQRLEADNLRLRLTQQQALFEAVQAAQEAERKRMAESLHNGIGQILYATKLRLDRLHAPALGADPGLVAARQEADQLLSEAIRQTRTLSHELVSLVLEEFGLAAALHDISTKMSSPQLRLHCHIDLDEAAPPLAPSLQLALYRMAQELAQNMVKHAHGATEASLELETTPGWVLLRMEDNGPGFAAGPAKNSGLGLRSIRDRVTLLGGQLEMGSFPIGGAYIRIRIPLPELPAP